MVVIWFNPVMTAKCRKITKMIEDIRGFVIPEEVPVGVSQDVVPEDELLENSNLGAYTNQVSEPWEICTFNPEFPELERLKSIVRSYGLVLFQRLTRKVYGYTTKYLSSPFSQFPYATMSIYSVQNFETSQDHDRSICI